ncbi:hypothetical protein CYMTET_36622 [Cymbomonas tetramitiformis]|uniref:AP2/ERF domain-containing protein n=1 Tax=Cymbomonas tetramitiformis TaxID=36881 RepID=A0AAE0CFL7_9CHLO|nr:hypothetical protein CYMTET_36622 [Cymbomonas tetramitiformis]
MRPAGVQGCDPDGAVPRGRGALASAPQSFAPGGIPGRPVRSLGGVNRFMVGEGGRIRGGKAGASEQATLPESSMPNAGRRQQWCHTYLEYIVGAGVDLSHADKNGRTPAHLAARLGRVEVLRMLPGAWFAAAEFGLVEVMRELLEKGAELDAEDGEGRTGLSVALAFGQEAAPPGAARAPVAGCAPRSAPSETGTPLISRPRKRKHAAGGSRLDAVCAAARRVELADTLSKSMETLSILVRRPLGIPEACRVLGRAALGGAVPPRSAARHALRTNGISFLDEAGEATYPIPLGSLRLPASRCVCETPAPEAECGTLCATCGRLIASHAPPLSECALCSKPLGENEVGATAGPCGEPLPPAPPFVPLPPSHFRGVHLMRGGRYYRAQLGKRFLGRFHGPQGAIEAARAYDTEARRLNTETGAAWLTNFVAEGSLVEGEATASRARERAELEDKGRRIDSPHTWSRFFGVAWVPTIGKFSATTFIPRRQVGLFVTEEDAAVAYDEAMLAIPGVERGVSPLNFAPGTRDRCPPPAGRTGKSILSSRYTGVDRSAASGGWRAYLGSKTTSRTFSKTLGRPTTFRCEADAAREVDRMAVAEHGPGISLLNFPTRDKSRPWWECDPACFRLLVPPGVPAPRLDVRVQFDPETRTVIRARADIPPAPQNGLMPPNGPEQEAPSSSRAPGARCAGCGKGAHARPEPNQGCGGLMVGHLFPSEVRDVWLCPWCLRRHAAAALARPAAGGTRVSTAPAAPNPLWPSMSPSPPSLETGARPAPAQTAVGGAGGKAALCPEVAPSVGLGRGAPGAPAALGGAPSLAEAAVAGASTLWCRALLPGEAAEIDALDALGGLPGDVLPQLGEDPLLKRVALCRLLDITHPSLREGGIELQGYVDDDLVNAYVGLLDSTAVTLGSRTVFLPPAFGMMCAASARDVGVLTPTFASDPDGRNAPGARRVTRGTARRLLTAHTVMIPVVVDLHFFLVLLNARGIWLLDTLPGDAGCGLRRRHLADFIAGTACRAVADRVGDTEAALAAIPCLRRSTWTCRGDLGAPPPRPWRAPCGCARRPG